MSTAIQTDDGGSAASRFSPRSDWAVLFGVWLFTFGSLWPVYSALGSDSNRFYVMHAHIGAHEHRSVGLTYEGPAGQRLATAQVVAVCVAASLSLLPQTWPRRIGRAALCLWCGLWLFNAVRFCLAAPFWVAYVILAAMVVCFGCMLLFTARGWRAQPTAEARPAAG